MSDRLPNSPAQWILLLAAAGIVLTSPYGGKAVSAALRAYLKKKAGEKEYERILDAQNISRALYRLKKRKHIKITREGSNTIIKLTEKGRRRKMEYEYANIKVPRPKKWDKRWRLLMFDIPNEESTTRDSFRDKLKRAGFIQFQKSVWLYPYPCEDEIDFIAEYLRIGKYLTLLTVRIENDAPLKERFTLS